MKKLVWLVYGIINKLKKFAVAPTENTIDNYCVACMFARLDQNMGKISHFMSQSNP